MTHPSETSCLVYSRWDKYTLDETRQALVLYTLDESYMTHPAETYTRHDSSSFCHNYWCVQRRLIYDIYETSRDTYETWLIQLWISVNRWCTRGTTHSHVSHDPSICVTWLRARVCNATPMRSEEWLLLWHYSLYVTCWHALERMTSPVIWLIIFDMTCAQENDFFCGITHYMTCTRGNDFACDMTHYRGHAL